MKTKRIKQTIQAASMADVAFLLLIFFMIVTTIAQDEGIFSKLPEYNPGEPIQVGDEQTMEIVLNHEKLLVDKQEIALAEFKRYAEQHLDKQGANAIFSLKYSRDTNYNNYINIQNVINEIYINKRNELALEKTNQQFSFDELKEKAKENKNYAGLLEQIKQEIPLVLIEDLEFAAKQ